MNALRPLRSVSVGPALVTGRPLPFPAGATLTEILIALLVMGIGLSSLAALFPLSIIRSVRANQLTVATQHRYNAEALLDLYPQLYADPNATDENSDGISYNDHFNEIFVVDPLGRALGLPDTIGNINRYSGVSGTITEAQADGIATCPDSWVTLYEERDNNGQDPTTENYVFQDLVNSQITIGSGDSRIVLFDVDGRRSEARPLDPALNGNVSETAPFPSNTVTWADPLPTGFGNIALCRIETKVRRFTWMLAVRGTGPAGMGGGSYDIEVAVFFNRSFDTNDEFAYDVDPNLPFQSGKNTVAITWTAGTDPEPLLKKGGFVFNADAGRWNRIQSYTSSPGRAVLTLERASRADGTKAVLPRGVVEVFPISTRTYRDPNDI